MKKVLFKYYVISIVLVGINLPNMAQRVQPKYLKEDDKSFKALTKRATPDGWLEFKDDANVQVVDFFKVHGKSIGLTNGLEVQLKSDETDKRNIRHQRFQLYFRNIPVERVEFTLHSQDDVLLLANGRIPENLDNDVSKSMPEARALELALANMKVSLADLTKLDRKKPDGTLLLARLAVEEVKNNFKLCY